MDEALCDSQTSIQHAAFEAAYLEMNPPDPASRRFAELVARHEERLRREWAAEEGGTVPPSDSAFPA